MISLLLASLSALAHGPAIERDPIRFIQVSAKNKIERSQVADFGMSIEFTRSDSSWGFATEKTIERIKASDIKILGNFDASVARGGHEGILGFPSEDSKFHDYDETVAELKKLERDNPKIAKLHVVGKSLEGRDMIAIQINTSESDRKSGSSAKPGIIFMGNHHAREHLSVEVPLMLAAHLLSNRDEPALKSILENRDIWILPMVNPDGAEYDIDTGDYKMWRKNRRNNGDGTYGVDLNRNYGYRWGTGGSSTDTDSDTYMGKTAFSEPETQVIKRFVEDRPNTTILLTFHTYSELILYPWGHTYNSMENKKDLAVFETMARTMAKWNGYTPEQSSDLYITSGDTTDWAYGEHGIFAFTFELSPKSMWGGGFYPGQKAIVPTFQANLQPCLYLIDLADNPYRATGSSIVNELGYMGPKNTFMNQFQ